MEYAQLLMIKGLCTSFGFNKYAINPGIFFFNPGSHVFDRSLYLIRMQFIFKIDAYIQYNIIGPHMQSQRFVDAGKLLVTADQLFNAMHYFRICTLSDKQSFRFISQPGSGCAKNKPDNDGGDAVKYGVAGPLTESDTCEGYEKSKQGGRVLKKHDKSGRIFFFMHR